MVKINKEIFRTYDIRGIYPDELNEKTAYAAARALVKFLHAKKIAIGHDIRLSSPKLYRAAIRGIIDEGAQAYSFGLAGIEMIYFVGGFYKMDGGIMITASHETKEYNGMKLVGKEATSLTAENGLKEIARLTQLNFSKKLGGKEKNINPWEDYYDFISGIIDLEKINPLKIVFDAGNGLGGLMIKPIIEKTKIKLFELNFTPNGDFPSHDPNPIIPKNRMELEKKVKEIKADVGFATDGDADRVSVVDENGELVMSDFVGVLIVKELAEQYKNEKVVWDLRRGWSVKETVEKIGLFYYAKAGYPFIKQEMRDSNAIFGGEASSHYFYREFFNSDSGVLTVLYLLRYLSKIGEKLSQAVEKLRQNYFMIEERNYYSNDINQLTKSIKDHCQINNYQTNYLDGISGEEQDWHFNFRPSNNPEPVYRLNLEARSKNKLDQKLKELESIILKYARRAE